jgi:hypothetical protein
VQIPVLVVSTKNNSLRLFPSPSFPPLISTPLLLLSSHSPLSLFSFLLLAKHGQPVKIVTFGAPRVFCSEVNIPENTEITMYRNGRDVVTTVPLGKHPVKLTNIGKKGLFWSWEDHGMKEYIKSLKEHRRDNG